MSCRGHEGIQLHPEGGGGLTFPSPATYSKMLLIDFSETFFVTVL